MKNQKKRLKIKWKNLGLLLVLIISVSIIIHDLFMITIYSLINSLSVSWTWYGINTFVIAIMAGNLAYDDLKEIVKHSIKKERF